MNAFEDRVDAGRQLAAHLAAFRGRDDVLVLGLPRGGVPVAAQVAQALHAPLDVMVVRKIGAPGQTELALGAVASGGVIVVNDALRHVFGDKLRLSQLAAPELAELVRRERRFRNDLAPLALKDRTVILVDDGAATGASMIAAIRATRRLGASQTIAAIPVAAFDALGKIEAEADLVVCLMSPPLFRSVGDWYRDFTQTTDEEVCRLLAESTRAHAAR